MCEARGDSQEELPRARGQGRQLGGATLNLRSEEVTERIHPVSEARVGARGQGRQPGGATSCLRPGW